jgi:RNA polymerase sigma-70 factor (ECF subfamily)
MSSPVLPSHAQADPGPTSARSAPTFRGLFQAEFGYVWNTLRHLGVQPRDLEDLTHDVFLAVHCRLGGYDPTRPVRPWLFGIAFRVASHYRQLARHRREVLGDAIDAPDAAAAVDEQLATHQARRLVLAGLDALDLERRAVLVMHDLDGHAMPEVAATLAIPLNTAYSRLRLAREQFAVAVRRLRRTHGDP